MTTTMPSSRRPLNSCGALGAHAGFADVMSARCSISGRLTVIRHGSAVTDLRSSTQRLFIEKEISQDRALSNCSYRDGRVVKPAIEIHDKSLVRTHGLQNLLGGFSI